MPRYLAFAALLPVMLSGCTNLLPSGQSADIPALPASTSGVVLAFDAPAALQPIPERTRMTYTLSDARPAEANLVFADADIAEGTLPAPAQGRAYFFMKPQNANISAADLVGAAVTINPVWCAAAALESATPTYSVRLVSTGAQTPLVLNQPALPAGIAPASC